MSPSYLAYFRDNLWLYLVFVSVCFKLPLFHGTQAATVLLQLPAQRHNVDARPCARFAVAVAKFRTAGGADDAATGSDHQPRAAFSHCHAEAAVHPQCCVMRHCKPFSDMLCKLCN